MEEKNSPFKSYFRANDFPIESSPLASIHPDYAGGRQFQKEMFTSGRYDMPDVYKRGMSFDSQTSF